MSETTIHQAIVAVMREVGAIGKDSKNEGQQYNYRSIEAVYNRVQPLFATHGIFSYPKVIEQHRETGKSKQGGDLHYVTLTVEYTFAAEDGSSIAVTVVGEGMDSGDKASNKAMAAAHKYALCQVLNIPYQVIDPDAFSPAWAEKLGKGVTLVQLKALYSDWATPRGTELKDLDKDSKKKQFATWVQETLGDNFTLGGALDVTDFRSWSTDDLKQCQEAVRGTFAARQAKLKQTGTEALK